MHPITRPMLAGEVTDLDSISFPKLCTPKIDGIRCEKVNGKALTRKFLPVPNRYIRKFIEKNIPDGCDGEIIIPNTDFHTTSGIVRSHDLEPDNFEYHIFDYVERLGEPYSWRMINLLKLKLPSFARKILPVKVKTLVQLEELMKVYIKAGYEGLMLRDPNGPYKLGRSTEREGYLLKLVETMTGEAKIIGFNEARRNDNELQVDNVGAAKRQTLAANMVYKGTLGSLEVRDLKTKQVFNVSGFPADMAYTIWVSQSDYLYQVIRYKFKEYGSKDKPRQPKFDGFRDSYDM